MQTLWQDLRYASRLLRKSPGFTAVAILTLAVAIGANAVVFGVINALILRPMNVPQVETLYGVERARDTAAIESYPNYVDLRARNRSFDDLAAFFIDRAALDVDGNPSSVWLYAASGNYFDVLGIQPYLGRFFHASDERGPNSAPFIVLTFAPELRNESCWKFTRVCGTRRSVLPSSNSTSARASSRVHSRVPSVIGKFRNAFSQPCPALRSTSTALF